MLYLLGEHKNDNHDVVFLISLVDIKSILGKVDFTLLSYGILVRKPGEVKQHGNYRERFGDTFGDRKSANVR